MVINVKIVIYKIKLIYKMIFYIISYGMYLNIYCYDIKRNVISYSDKRFIMPSITYIKYI